MHNTNCNCNCNQTFYSATHIRGVPKSTTSNIHTCLSTHTSIKRNTHTCMHTYMNTYMRTYMHTYIGRHSDLQSHRQGSRLVAASDLCRFEPALKRSVYVSMTECVGHLQCIQHSQSFQLHLLMHGQYGVAPNKC